MRELDGIGKGDKMIDIKELRKDLQAFKEKLKLRGITNHLEVIIDQIVDLDQQLRKIKTERDELICERKRLEREKILLSKGNEHR